MLSKAFMVVSILCSLVSLFFSTIALISVNKSKAVIHDLNWGKGHDKTDGISTDIFVGMFGLDVYQSNNNQEFSTRIMYNSDECNITFCRTCHKYMPVVAGFNAALILMVLITLFSDFSRFFGSGNNPTTKCLGMSGSLLSILFGLVSLIVFATTCEKKVEKYINEVIPDTFEFTYGSAFGLVAVSVCLMFVDMVFNGLVATSEAENGPAYGQVSSNTNPSAAAPPAASAPPSAEPTSSVAAPSTHTDKEVAMTSQV